MPVWIGPGQMQFTVTPDAPSSTASARVSPTTPCLLAVYGLLNAVAPSPSVEAMLTIRPSPLRVSWSRQARIRSTCARRFTAIVRSQCAG